MEEDAYELLQQYLNRLEASLKNEQGSREIIEDIELRIAELCSEHLSQGQSVIELKNIEDIIATMGDPADYVDDSETSENERPENQQAKSEKSEKRLFRDTENAVIAGVCSGIASFFNIDVVIIRAIFVIMFFFAGFGFPLYLILWFIVPRAKSTIDRLRMKGKSINVESVREEVETAADNLKKGSNRFTSQLKSEDSYGRHINRGVRILATLVGAFLIFIGIMMLIPFLIFIVGGFEAIPVANDQGWLSFADFGELVLANNSDFNLMATGIILLAFSVISFNILLGSMFVFNIRNKWAKLSLLLLFAGGITGGVLSGLSGINTGKDFVKGGELEEVLGSIETKELTIIPQNGEIVLDGVTKKTFTAESGMMEIVDKEVKLYGIHIDYVPSGDSLFHIRKKVQARGKNHEVASKRSSNIRHQASIFGDSLLVNTYYFFPSADKLRDQEVELIIEIPEGGLVRVKDRLISLDGTEIDDTDGQLKQNGYIRSNGKYRHYD